MTMSYSIYKYRIILYVIMSLLDIKIIIVVRSKLVLSWFYLINTQGIKPELNIVEYNYYKTETWLKYKLSVMILLFFKHFLKFWM